MKRKISKNPDRVYLKEGEPFICGLGHEWRCPACGTTFLVRTDKWGYILNGRKYCSYKCLRAAEKKKK